MESELKILKQQLKQETMNRIKMNIINQHPEFSSIDITDIVKETKNDKPDIIKIQKRYIQEELKKLNIKMDDGIIIDHLFLNDYDHRLYITKIISKQFKIPFFSLTTRLLKSNYIITPDVKCWITKYATKYSLSSLSDYI